MSRPPRGPMRLAAPQLGKPPALVDASGQPLDPRQPLTITAAELARELARHVEAGVTVGAKHGGQAAAESVLIQDVEYDEDGKVIRIREKRVPASEPTGKPPVGFHKRAAQ